MKKDVSSRSRWLCRTAMFIGIAALAAQVNASVVMNGTRFVQHYGGDDHADGSHGQLLAG